MIEDNENYSGKRRVKEILENEISEPEIMLFCKGDKKSTELLNLLAKMTRMQEYDKILKFNYEFVNEENDETEVKSDFVRYFYVVFF